MKKVPWILCVLMLASPGLIAESTIGVAGGINGAFMTGDALQDFQDYLVSYWLAHPMGPYYASTSDEVRAGVSAGVVATFDVSRLLAIQAEIWYAVIHSGMDVEFEGYSTVHEYTWTHRVIEVPILLKARLPLRSRGSFGRYRSEAGFYAGPEAMYLLDSPPTLEVEDDYGSDSEDWFTEADYHRLALSAIVGADLRFYLERVYFGIDLRLNWMLTSFDDMGAPYADDTRTPYVRASAQVGMRL